MDNKGFTLVELLATIVILGLVMGISAVGVTNVIENSRTRSEKAFVDKLSQSIDDYLDLNSSKLVSVNGSSYSFSKCVDKVCKNTYSVSAYELRKSDGTKITLRDLVNERLIDEAKLMNPRNKKKCLESGKNPEIVVYKDSDYVYYYYVDLSLDNTSCGILENNIINTLPDNLKQEVGLS